MHNIHRLSTKVDGVEIEADYTFGENFVTVWVDGREITSFVRVDRPAYQAKMLLRRAVSNEAWRAATETLRGLND